MKPILENRHASRARRVQSVAVCCSVLQCVAVYRNSSRGCRVLQCVEGVSSCSVLQCVAECCTVLQSVAVRGGF